MYRRYMYRYWYRLLWYRLGYFPVSMYQSRLSQKMYRWPRLYHTRDFREQFLSTPTNTLYRIRIIGGFDHCFSPPAYAGMSWSYIVFLALVFITIDLQTPTLIACTARSLTTPSIPWPDISTPTHLEVTQFEQDYREFSTSILTLAS